jgi:ELWxxDGT repeat protein
MSNPRYLSILLSLCFSSVLFAAAVPHSFSNGQVADANQVNANFDALVQTATTLEQDVKTIEYQIVTSDAVLSDRSRVMVVNQGTDIELTLPAASTVPGRLYQVHKLQGSRRVDITTASGNFAAPFVSARLAKAGRLEVFSDGTKWHLLERSGEGSLVHPLSRGFGIVADIDPTGNSSPDDFVELNGLYYFSAYTNNEGRELWVTDGTAAGTQMVADIELGSAGSSPQHMVTVGSEIFFEATTSGNGYELWKTDGTQAGTVLVKDIYPGASSSSPYQLIPHGSGVIFRANDGNGNEPWYSDGTEAGTVMLMDIYPGASASNPNHFVSNGSTAYFTASNVTYGQELWITDGTPGGTSLVKDIALNALASSPNYLTFVGSDLFFRATNSGNGYELWKTNGTEAGTVLVKDIYPGASGSSPDYFRVIDGLLYFSANDGVNGDEPWTSDGTDAGTQLLVDLYPGSNSSYAEDFVKVGGNLLIFESNNYNIYHYDGTDATNWGYFDLFSFQVENSSHYTYFFPFKNGVIFASYPYDGEEAIYWTDGHTFPIKLAGPHSENNGWDIDEMRVFNDRVLFQIEDYGYGGWGEELYILGGDTPPVEPATGIIYGGGE